MQSKYALLPTLRLQFCTSLLLAGLLTVLLAAPSLAAPPVITVGNDPQTCDFTDLDEALWLAPDDTRIEIAAGTYFFDRVTFGSVSVSISGGHDGCGGDVLPNGRSILDGGKAHQVMDLGAFQPVTIILQRLELRNGRGTPIGGGPANGAGLRVFGPVQLLLSDVIFRNNINFLGGALAIAPAPEGAPSVLVRNSQFLFNRAVTNEFPFGLGGAIHCRQAALEIDQTTLASNVAIRDGGAVYAESCAVEITDSQFDNNRALQRGGAIFASGSHLEIGALPCAAGGCVTFTENQADDSGGAVALMTTSAEIFGVMARDNTSVGHGAFLWAKSNQPGKDVDVLSSVITGGNGKSQIYTRTQSKMRLLSSTIFDNPSQQRAMLDLDDAESHVSHVIFSGNGGAPTRQDPDVFTCNLIDGPFAPPANSMLTIFEAPSFVAEGDYHLQANSPGVDVCPFGMFEAANADLDGDLRPDAVGLNDIGADEVRN